MTKMENFEISSNRSLALPLFLTGLGTGIAIALLLAPATGAATRRLIGRKVRGGESWVKGKVAEAEDFILTQGAELRDRVKGVAEVIGQN